MTPAPDWIWYGEDETGNTHVTFGRWARHSCQRRYKYAIPQATEHDRDLHPTRSVEQV